MNRKLSTLITAAALLALSACTTDSKDDKEGGLSAADIALVARYAGNYAVNTSIPDGSHIRNTIVIDSSGGIDFDVGLTFTTAHYLGVYDRLHVTDTTGGPRIQVEIKPSGSLPQRRIRLFVDTVSDVPLYKAAYYPDAASDAGVVAELGLLAPQ
jgi:hypothetical protein